MRDKKIVQGFLLVSLILTLSAMTASAQNNRLKVMTWNIAGGRCGHAVPDMRPFANHIRAKNPDVIAIQEIHFDQAYWLAYHLNNRNPYYVQFVWAQRCVYKNPSAPSLADYGNAILSRYPIRPEGGYFDGGFKVSDDPNARDRGEYIKVAAASVQLRTPDNKSANGPWVRIYSAHLTGNNGLPPGGAQNAAQQVVDTLVHIDRTDARAWGQPRTILMGDFNAHPSTGPCPKFKPGGYDSYNWLTYHYRADFQFVDAWLVKPPDPNISDPCGFTVIADTAQNPDKRYDYIFLRNAGRFKVTKMEVVNMQPRHLSDHFPVYAELTF